MLHGVGTGGSAMWSDFLEKWKDVFAMTEKPAPDETGNTARRADAEEEDVF